MSVRSDGDPAARAATRLVASVPWAVVGIGVGLLVTLLVLAMSAFRGSERAAAPDPAPPMVFPSLPATAASPTPAEPRRATPTARVTAAPSASTSGRPTPRPSPTTDRPSLFGSGFGTVTARYRTLDSDQDTFRAELSVRNDTGASRGWEVELRFAGNVEGVRVSSSAAISVTVRGAGWYVVRGGPLAAGASQTVTLRFTGSGADEYPDQCTVEDGQCVLG
ncbi:Cellulose binding domain [Micromonospora nigra]|uniref:Cellulose binding domain n=1 Tax=Micromonospora nigra TaxID=145857 RepID=A0A1C6RE59_9ACTN|nr:hypothetical protein [Micromonospora nigra]SCL15442.1 Cellulose binding domain [Micromonospora nigra]